MTITPLLNRADIYRLVVLVIGIAITWCFIQDRLTRKAWRVPLALESDALVVVAIEKSVSEGLFVPLLPKYNPYLGAPNVASWNDFPVTDEPSAIVGGSLAKIFGLFPATNFLVLLAHAFAAISFYLVARAIGCGWEWSILGSTAFGLSPYAFQRGMSHMTLTNYWHVPLCLLVAWWCGSRQSIRLRSRQFYLALLVAVITGVHNPYYSNFFLQFLGFAFLAHIIRRSPWDKIAAPLIIGTVCFLAFIAMNIDTIIFQRAHGGNPFAAARSYQAVEKYALKPLDFLIPPPGHRLAVASAITWNYTYSETRKVYVIGEMFSPYLGLLGIASLLTLSIVCVGRTLGPIAMPLPVEALQIGWLIFYSIIGGVNGLIAQLGAMFFRCSNRYSICVLAIALFFGMKFLTRFTYTWKRISKTVLLLGLLAMVLWDQLPPRMSADVIDQQWSGISSDKNFTRALEKQLTPGALVFQLPVMRYPESWPIQRMGDYEHFRPYLYSQRLRYSYGDEKGRGSDDWQMEVAALSPPEMISALESYGFAALYINRRGFSDNGAALVSSVKAAGRSRVLESKNGDLIAIFLQPSALPVVPERPPNFSQGWYDQESDSTGATWRYSSGNAELSLTNSRSVVRKVALRFELSSPSPRTVTILKNADLLYSSPQLSASKTLVNLTLELPAGITTLLFKTGPPVVFAGNPDTRSLGFILSDINLTDVPGQE